MIQKYYTYKDKIIEADKKQPLLLPILGIITEFIRDNRFDRWDLHIVVAAVCGKININLLAEMLITLSKIGLIRSVRKSSYDEYDNTYRSNIKYSDYRYILFKLYNK